MYLKESSERIFCSLQAAVRCGLGAQSAPPSPDGPMPVPLPPQLQKSFSMVLPELRGVTASQRSCRGIHVYAAGPRGSRFRFPSENHSLDSQLSPGAASGLVCRPNTAATARVVTWGVAGSHPWLLPLEEGCPSPREGSLASSQEHLPRQCGSVS